VRWQLEHQSMLVDSTIALLTLREIRRLPHVVTYAERGSHAPGCPVSGRPHTSKHRNPPFQDGVFGKSATLCLYYRRDPKERRWTPEHGLLGLFDIARVHVTNEHIWRRTGNWPSEDAPHGLTAPAQEDPSLALPPLSPRNTLLLRRPGVVPAGDEPSALKAAA